MRFEYQQNSEIPKLSWCLFIEKNQEVVKVMHGEWVEVKEAFFIEGTWDGVFANGDIDKVESLMGSGCVISNDRLILCPPSNTTECIYSVKKNDKLWASNSLTFVLEASDTSLDYTYLDYENDILSVSDGLSKYKRLIPLSNNDVLNIHLYNNFEVSERIELREIPKKSPPKFEKYSDYKGYLDRVLKNMSKNASDPKRLMQYKPIVFCSNGYDSVACAALGKDIGCDEAVVFESKRSSRSDSGRPIVEFLGYEVIHEKHELEYKDINLAHEFVASGELGTSIYFSASERELEGKLLLSGVHGDRMWDIEAEPDEDLKRSFFPDLAKKEFRLRTGFLNVVVPFIGVKRQPEIVRISNSQEMKNWSIGNDYDRPIARRFAEEKGVPRDLFGIHKVGGTASSLRFLNLNYLKKVMPEKSFLEFEKFYDSSRGKRKKSVKWMSRSILYLTYCSTIFLEYRKFSIPYYLLRIEDWSRKFRCSPWAPSFLFYWGVEKLSKVYSNKIDFLK